MGALHLFLAKDKGQRLDIQKLFFGIIGNFQKIRQQILKINLPISPISSSLALNFEFVPI